MTATLLGQGGGLACRSSDTPTAETRPRRSTSREPNVRETQAAANIDLAALQTDVPEYAGRGRDLFSYGREPSPVVERPPVAAPTATTVPPTPRGPAQNASAPQPVVDLKFAGFVEKTQANGEQQKFAVFLSGEEIFTGTEGEIVGNRYKVVEIGLESVTVAVEGTQFTQKIPLRAN